MGLLNTLFGNKKEELKKFQSRGAIIIDVRTPQEFKQGAISGSKNIPLQTISLKIETIKKLNKPVITCCASGMRSSNAASILRKNGIECINGGGWVSLKLNYRFKFCKASVFVIGVLLYFKVHPKELVRI